MWIAATALPFTFHSAGSAVFTKPARDQFGQIVPTKTVLDLRAETNTTDADADAPGNTNPQE
mgnify:CR=1 FL=1